jgi:AcrR family transcriptional regulator
MGSPAQPGPSPRVQRKLERTRRAIEDAFAQLVAERGYAQVEVQAIAERADVARGTFYAHFPDKEAVLLACGQRLADGIVARAAPELVPEPAAFRSEPLHVLFDAAAEQPDLFRACMSVARTRKQFMGILRARAGEDFHRRVQALGREPRLPAAVIARGISGILGEILEGWLDGELEGTPEEMARMTLDLIYAGAGWADGYTPEEMGYA